MGNIAVLDVGTRNVKALIFDENGELAGEARRAVNLYTPRPGFVEQDGLEVLRACASAYREAYERVGRVDGLAITNHRASVILWDKAGEPLSPIVTWMDVRGHAVVERLKREAAVEGVFELLLNPNASSMYLLWLLENLGLKDKARRREVLYGTLDSFLVYAITGGKAHATDPSNASCTGLLNPVELTWWADFAEAIGLPLDGLPEVQDTAADFGIAETLPGKPRVVCVMADQQSALFGEACFEEGDIKATHGSGSFVDVNTGSELKIAGHPSLIPMVAWRVGNSTAYMLEGYFHFSGELLVWLSELGVLASPEEVDALAASVKDSGGVCVVPALSGLTFPEKDPSARGAMLGLTRSTGKAHIARACLEAIAYMTYEIVKAISGATGIKVKRMACDGGLSRSDRLLQLISDICGTDVERPLMLDATGLGAFYMAALYTGMLGSLDDVRRLRRVQRVFRPSGPGADIVKGYERWRRAVERSKGWEV